MSQKVQKQGNKLKIDETKQDKRVNDIVDRPRMSWILDLVLNQKSQQEIIKDIADGIFNFKEIEDIFPWKFVQHLREHDPEYVQNYEHRFKNMTDERMKGLLTVMLRRKSRDEILKLITDHSPNLDNIQKSYLQSHVEQNEEAGSSMTANVLTCLKKLSLKDAGIRNSKESKDVGTKKKTNTVRKGEKDVDTKKKGKNVEKVAKKVRAVKLKNEKRVGDIKSGNKVEETSKEISLTEQENRSHRAECEKAWANLTESLMQIHHGGFEELLLKSFQGDRAEYESSKQCDTKKTANSKSLANDDAKLADAKKASKKVGKGVKPGSRNKGKGKVENLATLTRNDDYIEENEKPKSDESEVENENARTSYAMRNECFPETEGFEDSLQKSRTNQVTNITSITSEEQDIYGNKENELSHVEENNFNIQLDTSTPKKFNSETKMIKIKEEPKSECSFNEFDYPIENIKEKDLNISKDAFKEVASRKKLRKKRNDLRTNTKLSNTGASELKKVSGPSKVAKVEKNRSCVQKETNTGRKVKNTRTTEDKWRSFDRKDRRKKASIRRHEKKMQKTMAQFSNQVIRLVKEMGYLEEEDESSSSSSSESSYSSSSESCSCSSCSCCDYSSSDEYSEYTLCSCSNCSSSWSSTDCDYDKEE